MLLGVLSPTKGVIQYFGQDFAQHKSESLQQVTFASTYIKMPWRLTVWENLKVYGTLYDVQGKVFDRRMERFLNFFGVWDQRDKTMNQLSAGQTTRIMLAKAFLPYPRIVLLDEPTASLDPDIAHSVREFVKIQRRDHGVSILYTSHNMDEVTDVCDEVMFLKKGQIIAVDKPLNLARSVKTAKMRLLVKDGLKRIAKFAKAQQMPVTIEGREAIIEIDEQAIASFLIKLAGENISYSQIAIDKPNLEDYFLQMSKDQS
jgi:ABC-2 type transport system ATP-binding protein